MQLVLILLLNVLPDIHFLYMDLHLFQVVGLSHQVQMNNVEDILLELFEVDLMYDEIGKHLNLLYLKENFLILKIM